MSELDDWNPFDSTQRSIQEQPSISILNLSPYDRKLKMLTKLSDVCRICTMCELGMKPVNRDSCERDPHVFSNLNPTRIMVVGQGPGFDEVRQGAPFVGNSGANFDRELEKHGMSRDEFYITNTVKCWIEHNDPPSELHCSRCQPFLQMELNLIKPKLVVTLGAVAFGQICPDLVYSQSLGTIVKSQKYDIPVFAIYHPSPRNLSDPDRLCGFQRQIELLCSLLKRLKQQDQTAPSSP